MSDCPGCDGSGWYTPVFSPTALVNCLICNADWSKADWSVADDDDTQITEEN